MSASAATTAVRHQRARGTARLGTALLDGRTRIRSLYQEGCAKIRLPRTHAPHLDAVLINTAGGLTGGDRVAWAAEAAPGAHLVLTTQASERIYRSLGDAAEVSTTLHAAAGARLDWLPQETILFEGARLRRTLDIELAEGAACLAVEAVILGREAMGEAAQDVWLRDDWRVRRAGRLLHAEATRLTGDPLERTAVSLLAGARAFATVLLVAPGAARRLDACREIIGEAGGASATEDRLVIRLLAASGLALRQRLVPLLTSLSGAGALPRLWQS